MDRMTLMYFVVSGLDLLGGLEKHRDSFENWRQWIYDLYIEENLDGRSPVCGFRGGPFLGSNASRQDGTSRPLHRYDVGHLAMTYTALITLLILEDDLSKIKKESILDAISHLQRPNGSFIPCLGSDEADMRFLFCACAISFILNDWRAVNIPLAVEYIISSISYDGAFGQGPLLESHGGSTFCALAALKLMNKIDALSDSQRDAAVMWCLNRQGTMNGGFQGRINKVEDTCYSFWIGASLHILDGYKFVDTTSLKQFLQSTHTKYGGYSKTVESKYPDLLHSYLGLAGQSLSGDECLKPLNPELNITYRAFEWMKEHCVFWKNK